MSPSSAMDLAFLSFLFQRRRAPQPSHPTRLVIRQLVAARIMRGGRVIRLPSREGNNGQVATCVVTTRGWDQHSRISSVPTPAGQSQRARSPADDSLTGRLLHVREGGKVRTYNALSCSSAACLLHYAAELPNAGNVSPNRPKTCRRPLVRLSIVLPAVA
jgi:hypothetical protein